MIPIDLCKERCRLQEADIERLQKLSECLPQMAELCGGDVFIDGMDTERNTAVVLAQAGVSSGTSAYEKCVVGRDALRSREPAVYRALENGIAVRELKALTQEGVFVRQDAVPIFGEGERIIGVLIREKDISDILRNDEKLAHLMREKDALAQETLNSTHHAPQEERISMREVHHRVKNNLQMVASIMNLQMRHSKDEQVRTALKEQVQRILSISAIHELLTANSCGEGASLQYLLARICRNIRVISGGAKQVSIHTGGEDVHVNADVATSVAIVVNELVSNALEHAFAQGQSGEILVNVERGELFVTVSVQDNGCGYNISQSSQEQSLGLALVNLTVKDKLKGRFSALSDENGTRAFFTIKM